MNSEIEYITEVLVENEYPLDIVQSNICAKIVHFNKPNTYGPEDYPVCNYFGLVTFAQGLLD